MICRGYETALKPLVLESASHARQRSYVSLFTKDLPQHKTKSCYSCYIMQMCFFYLVIFGFQDSCPSENIVARCASFPRLPLFLFSLLASKNDTQSFFVRSPVMTAALKNLFFRIRSTRQGLATPAYLIM